MSLRKNKFTQEDKLFMNLALNLARDRLGLTGENPSVGCVIVKNNTIISTYCALYMAILVRFT